MSNASTNSRVKIAASVCVNDQKCGPVKHAEASFAYAEKLCNTLGVMP
jgi:hypothetical protein